MTSAVAAAPDHAPSPDDAPPAGPRSFGSVSLGTPGALLLGGSILFIAIAYVPGLYAATVTARVPVVALGGALGVAALGRLVRAHDPAARWLAAFLAWSLLSSLLSARPYLSIIPAPGDDQGWLFLLAFGGWWALGRTAAHDAGRLVTGALVAGGLANVALAVGQAAKGGSFELLDFRYGRSTGFYGNPVYLGGYLAGAVLLAVVLAHRSNGRRWWLWLAVVTALAAGINLSGSRVALAGSAGLAVLALGITGDRRIRGGLVLAAFALGVLLSWSFAPQAGGARVADGGASGGVTPRGETWKAGLTALRERPVQGWGPNRYAAASAPRTSLAQARAEEPDTLFFDAHNVVVEHLVTTGVVGIVLLGGFGWTAARRARGPFAWFAAGVCITWLLEPAQIGTAPLALAALGLAGRPPPADHDGTIDDAEPPARAGRSPVWLAANVGLVALALFGSFAYVSADRHLAVAYGSASTADALVEVRAARRWFPRDADLSDREAYALMVDALKHPTSERKAAALAAARRSTELDPQTFAFWLRLGQIDLSFGPGTREQRFDRARGLYLEALKRNPWSHGVMASLYELALVRKDTAEMARWRAKLCAINQCPPPVRPRG